MRLKTVAEKATSILSPLSLKAYEKMFTKPYFDALCDGREDGVKKADKVALWKDVEEILPPAGFDAKGKDPFGLVSLIDRAYLQAYKLHSKYSSAMRFHRAAVWLRSLVEALEPNEEKGWIAILRSLAKSETATYALDRDRMTLVTRGNNVKNVRQGEFSSSASQSKTPAPTLF